MAQTKAARRARRSFTDEFKAGAVRLVLDEGRTVADVARSLDLTPSGLSGWVEQARADRSKGKTGLTTEEKQELARLSIGDLTDAPRRASTSPGADRVSQKTSYVK